MRAARLLRAAAGTSQLAAAMSLYSPSAALPTCGTCAIRRQSVPKSTPMGLDLAAKKFCTSLNIATPPLVGHVPRPATRDLRFVRHTGQTGRSARRGRPGRLFLCDLRGGGG